MENIARRLRRVLRRIDSKESYLEFVISRVRHFSQGTLNAHKNGLHADRMEKQWRKRRKPWREQWWRARSNRSHGRAVNRMRKAKYWRRERIDTNKALKKLNQVKDNVIHDRDKWLKEHGVLIQGNEAKGGTARQRVVAVAKAAAAADVSGKRDSFYSQAGAWTTRYAVTGEPRGYRSDCSQWITSVYRSAGLADPNGAGYGGGFTGTLVAHGKPIDREQLQPGDLVIYGYGNGFHVEMYVGDGKTIGHGSTPVDYGTVDMIGGYKRYRSYI